MAKGRVFFNVERCKSCGLCVDLHTGNIRIGLPKFNASAAL